MCSKTTISLNVHRVVIYVSVFFLVGGGTGSDLPKLKFSVEFPKGLHVILQLQIKKFKTANYLKCKIILTENP